MLKVQLVFLFFVDMQDSVEEVLVLLHKHLGELQFLLLKNIVPAAKRIGAKFFEIAAPEIREVVKGQKKLKKFAKMLEKNSSKTVGSWKK